MAKNNITQYDATAANNTDIDSINIDEGMAASDVNNALRSLMSHLKNVDTGSQALTALSVTGNLLVGGTTTNHQAGSSQEQLSYIAGDYFAVSRSSNDVAFFNRQSTDGSIINVRKDGTTVGTIGSRAGVALNIVLDPRTDGCGLTGVGQVIRPTDESGTNEDNTIDLGSSSHRFKDIYLSSGVRVGGTGSANLLDDYEFGSFTPTWNSYTPASSSGKFVKVGNQVTVYAKLVTGTSNDGSSVSITNLPFTISGDLGAGSVYHNTAGLRDMHIVTDFTANSTTCRLHGVLSGSDTTIKYVGTSPALGGSSTLIWILHYQTI